MFRSVEPSRIRRRDFLHAGSLATVAALAGCTVLGMTPATETTTRTLDVSDGTPIAVANQNGRVTVETHDADETEFEVTRRSSIGSGGFDEVSVDASTDAETYTVSVSYGSDAARTRVSVHFDLTVSADQPIIEARTAYGEVPVQDTTGDLTAVSQNGGVDVSGVDGYVSARTANGSVNIEDAAGVD